MSDKAQVTADLILGSRSTHNRFVTVPRAAVVLALGSVPADVLDHESHPESGFVIVRRKEFLAALESVPTTSNDEPNGEPEAGI